MPLEDEDSYRLQIWSFLTDFLKHRLEFLELARVAYHSTSDLKGSEPTPDDCERIYAGVLLSTAVFRGVLARKHFLLPSFYHAYALAFARYVLHNYWDEIRF